MSDVSSFEQFVRANIEGVGGDKEFERLTNAWLCQAIRHNYAQNFSWLGRPVIQIPQDLYAIQEIVWQVRPDLVIETGIAHGGSLVMSASMLALLDYCEAVEAGKALFDELTGVLGLLTHEKMEEFPAEATALLEERQAARKAKNFARADEIRDALKDMGFTVEDTANGPKLKKI